jgi:MFS family permease
MMGGVNTSPDYVKTMNLGFSTYQGPSEGYVVTITKPTKQGGIVSSELLPFIDSVFHSWQSKVYYLGTLIGCLMGGVIGDKIGRIKTMLIGGIWVVVGASLQCSAQNLAWSATTTRLVRSLTFVFKGCYVPVLSMELGPAI